MAVMWYIYTSLCFLFYSNNKVKVYITGLLPTLYLGNFFFPAKQNNLVLDKLERCLNYFISTCLEYLGMLYFFLLFSKQIQRTGNIQNNNTIVPSKIGRDLIFIFCFLRVRCSAWYIAGILSVFIQETSWVPTNTEFCMRKWVPDMEQRRQSCQ